MCGRATLAMVVSSEFIIVASMIEMVIGRPVGGVLPRRSAAASRGAGGGRARRSCRPSTLRGDSPRAQLAGRGGLSKAIRTGRRWTTFTQLPVAFCGGRGENAAPVPGEKLATWPLHAAPG